MSRTPEEFLERVERLVDRYQSGKMSDRDFRDHLIDMTWAFWGASRADPTPPDPVTPTTPQTPGTDMPPQAGSAVPGDWPE